MAKSYAHKRVRPTQANRREAAYRKAMSARTRRRFAQGIDPDADAMTDKFLATKPAINEDGREIYEISGQGEVSDDLVEPTLKGDSKAPVQDSVTARRRRAMMRRRAEECKGKDCDKHEDEKEDEEKESKRCGAEDASNANEESVDIIEDEKERDEDVMDKVSKAAMLASAMKQHGAISANADTICVAADIAKHHTASEISYAYACMSSIGRNRNASRKIPRNVSASKKTANIAQLQATTRKVAAASDTDASALFM